MEIVASQLPIRSGDHPESLAFYCDGVGRALAHEYSSGTVFSPNRRWSSSLATTVPPEPGMSPERCG